MPHVDVESALTLPNSPMDSLHDHSGGTPQHEQPETSMFTNHIPANRTSDTGQKKKKKQPPKPKLLHPILHSVPFHFRFGLNGFLSNVLFMVAYNAAVAKFEQVASSTIYATVYLIFIPISHIMISLLVFGWPERYIRSLMSNAPVGLTAIVLGAALTAYLDDIEFNVWVADAVTEYQNLSGNTNTTTTSTTRTLEESHGGGEFYSSLFVLIVTSIWTFVLSVMVNAPAESLEKKEL